MNTDQHLETSQASTTTTWDADPAHSGVAFSVRHLMFAKVRGRFRGFRATLQLDEADPSRSRLEADIDAASIDTAAEDRDAHLRSGDFLDAEQHPSLSYRSRSVEIRGKDRARVLGELTIRGVTREVALDVTREGTGTDPWGKARQSFTATAEIDRRDFGLTWNQVLETGGVLVGEKVRIEIDAQMVERSA